MLGGRNNLSRFVKDSSVRISGAWQVFTLNFILSGSTYGCDLTERMAANKLGIVLVQIMDIKAVLFLSISLSLSLVIHMQIRR